MSRARWVRWILVYPLLIAGGLYASLTGSPIPLWHLESLDSPVQVKEITEEHLVLADGRTVRVPFIRRLPATDPHFVVPVSHGVEVAANGDVYVLMWIDRICGNDPYRWVRMRINLSELAAAIDPTGVDDTKIDPEAIAFLTERWTESKTSPDRRVPGRTSYYQMGSLMHQARRILESASAGNPGERGAELRSSFAPLMRVPSHGAPFGGVQVTPVGPFRLPPSAFAPARFYSRHSPLYVRIPDAKINHGNHLS